MGWPVCLGLGARAERVGRTHSPHLAAQWRRDGSRYPGYSRPPRGRFRAWTHKLNFPPDSRGRWQVHVVTDSGQLMGMTNCGSGLKMLCIFAGCYL
ncbi:MAG: DUF2914 domain-containing protein [Porticoccaceae bacterium]